MVNTFDPFGLFVAHDHGGEQEHRRLPGGQLRAGAAAEHEPAPELQHDGQPARVPRAGGVRVHRRRRQPRHRAATRSCKRALIQNVDAPLGDVPAAAAASSPPACSSSTSTSRSSASSSPARSRSSRSRTPTRRATSASSSKPAHDLGAALLRQRQLHLRRLEDHAAARAADGADVARAAAGRPVEEPVQPDGGVHAAAASRRACSSTTSATASRTSAPTRRPTSSRRAADAVDLVFAQRLGAASTSASRVENLTDSRLPVHAGRRDAAALQAGPHLRLVVRLQRVLRRMTLRSG